MKAAETKTEQFTGKFYRRLHRSQDNAFCICLYTEKSTRNTVTVVGPNLPEVTYAVTFTGKWVVSEKYGRQFQADMAINQLPETAKDVISYIASLKVGIGTKKAERMIQLVGIQNFWKEMEKDPMQFCTVKGVSQQSLFMLQEKLSSQAAQQGLFKLFAGDLSCDGRQYKRILAYFDNDMDRILESITQNPFVLMQCGYDFKDLDFYSSRHTSFAVNDYRRLLAAAQQALMDARQASHVGLPGDILLGHMAKLLDAQGGVNREELEAFLSGVTATSNLVFSNGLYYLPRAYQEETKIAELLAQMLAAPAENISRSEFDDTVKEYEHSKSFSLSDDQRNAVWTALTRKICIITGGPGTGKSTILDALLFCWNHFFGEAGMLMAPTGKAAARMTETTQKPATTIHSALGLSVGNEQTEGIDERVCPINSPLIVVDECSMLDQTVMVSILMALQEPNDKVSKHLILVGDPEQLPSVGWGNVLADLIASDSLPVCRLNTIYRQGAGNPIITNATKMQAGDVDLDFSQRSFQHHDYGSDSQNLAKACAFYQRCVNAYGMDNVAMLSPYHKATDISYNALNRELQEALNPGNGIEQVKSMGQIFRPGDRVMQLRNTDSLTNGDIGMITSVNPQAGDSDPCVVVKFENGVVADYLRDQLNQLDLAYATSIHKSQGSQWPVVIIVLPQRFTSFLRRNLLYTAITRSSKNVAIFSSMDTIRCCISNNKKDDRYTNLIRRVQQAVSVKNAA